MYNLEQFSKADMCQCAVTLRNMDERSQSMEETADRVVRYLYENFVDPRTGKPACALIRFFVTHPFGFLPAAVQESARGVLQGQYVPSATKCLTLLATAGDEPQWNHRQGSTGHQGIPLLDQDFVHRAPMILQLIQQFGLEVSKVIETVPTLITDTPHRSFNVFYVPAALDSPYIPAQKQFVKPYGVQSVLGFGGLTPAGELFAVILFSKVPIPLETANRFRWLSAYVRIAIEGFDRASTFAEQVALAAPGLR
ncbi:hypothetical protein IQ265_15725 [Nodosilinea sp. LEGE 06152]|uniref:hypothetical protein n=1 Tax=Nodosilinea sp. LEGE 06152 TaxID=2777966 RepID=UPI001882B007|nr:hypothetical protein [Nodosilinea sp. LEGE 06152]MBE9158265.1 hypothetical protein [Nodosilinea sp. LEGE 06152]